jgi:putative N6-adenine-specific DNA methylase
VNQYFATVARGLEALTVEELEQLGAHSVKPGFCGVAFEGDLTLLYHLNLWARLPFRILQTLSEFPCQDAQDLYQGTQAIDWRRYLTPEHTLAVKATGKSAQLNHTHFTALQVKNAIVEQQQQFGDRSDVDSQNPDVLVNVHIYQNRCTLSLDSSGSSLHRRGYRPAVGAAPLKESLAAALIRLSQWQPELAFMDPLCGSGTLPLEAGMIALHRAPGLYRERFGFETWPDFDFDLWQGLRQSAIDGQRDVLGAVILGCDRNPEVIQQARDNAANCGIAAQVQFEPRELVQAEAPADSGILICNPPYGERLGNKAELGSFYKLLGDTLKQQFKGWTAFVLSGNKALSRTIGLRSSARTLVYNGPLPCQLMKYELY